MFPIVSQMMAILASCLILQQPLDACIPQTFSTQKVAGIHTDIFPEFTGNSLDVVISAESALVWDVDTGKILYEKNARARRPIASINKLLSALYVRSRLQPEQTVEISSSVLKPQRLGANIKLPVGEHTSVRDLLAASMIASANDAIVALADATSGSEEQFVQELNTIMVPKLGLHDTQAANASGLSGGDQYSTAYDVKVLLSQAYNDPVLHSFLGQKKGTLTTLEGSRRTYETTNDLLGTYLPILAAKTGYTVEAGQNVTILTQGEEGQRIGVIILGSQDRFQDAKVVTEWIWRNYTWPKTSSSGTM